VSIILVLGVAGATLVGNAHFKVTPPASMKAYHQSALGIFLNLFAKWYTIYNSLFLRRHTLIITCLLLYYNFQIISHYMFENCEFFEQNEHSF
jgi:hypothetical protein